MASRPVFQMIEKEPYCTIDNVEFQYYPGFSITQKQKSIKSLHDEYLRNHQKARVLEISSKSKLDIGVKLSAFNLMFKYQDTYISVECAFQGSKVFELGGPYSDIYFKSSSEAKKDVRLRESGRLTKFTFDGVDYSLEPKDSFYNWIYINALHNNELTNEVIQFDAFTDIEFNPQKSINCQAKAVAIYVGLVKCNKIVAALKSFEVFKSMIY